MSIFGVLSFKFLLSHSISDSMVITPFIFSFSPWKSEGRGSWVFCAQCPLPLRRWRACAFCWDSSSETPRSDAPRCRLQASWLEPAQCWPTQRFSFFKSFRIGWLLLILHKSREFQWRLGSTESVSAGAFPGHAACAPAAPNKTILFQFISKLQTYRLGSLY